MSFAAKIRKAINSVQPSVALKITLWYMLLLILTVLTLSSVTFWGNREALLKEKRQTLDSAVTNVLNTLNERGERQGIDLNDPDVLSGYVPKEGQIQITSPDGKLLQKSGEFKILLPFEKSMKPQIRDLNGVNVYYTAHPILIGSQVIGYLQAAVDIEEVALAQKVLLQQLFWLAGSSLLLAAIGGLFLSRQVIAPLETLNKEISNLTAQDLNRRIPLRGNGDEIDRLGKSFNQMMIRLEKSFLQQKQFVANASHELRTPLMVMRGHADILTRWGADDPVVVRDSAEAIGAEVVMMTKLVENLLTLAREELSLTLGPVNFPELIIESIEELPFLRHFRVDYDLVPEQIIYGDALYLKQLLRIILENAGKYVPQGGNIHISLKLMSDTTARKSGVLLYIEDNGPGIPAIELENIFDRFYRVDQARSRNIPGHGLGLSIAKKIVEAHHGKIRAENVQPHGARFCIEISNMHEIHGGY